MILACPLVKQSHGVQDRLDRVGHLVGVSMPDRREKRCLLMRHSFRTEQDGVSLPSLELQELDQGHAGFPDATIRSGYKLEPDAQENATAQRKKKPAKSGLFGQN